MMAWMITSRNRHELAVVENQTTKRKGIIQFPTTEHRLEQSMKKLVKRIAKTLTEGKTC